MPRAIWATLMVVGAIAAGIAYGVFSRVRTDATSAGANPTVPQPAVTPANSLPSKPGRRSPIDSSLSDLKNRPFAEIRPELERRATAGDGGAARQLGVTLARCNHYVAMSTSQIESRVVDAAAMGASIQDGEHTLTPDEMLARLKLANAQAALDCKNVSGLDESDASQHALEWIERAAAWGDADAQALYGSLAFSSYDTRSALTDAEGVRERKQRAIDYLQRSLAQGDGLALRQMAIHYAAGDLYPANPENAYAYWYAYSLSARASDIVPELLEQMLAESTKPLDEETRQRARDRGTQIAACCGPTGASGP